MQFATDLHLHSKYSRAVSPQMILPVMADYARQKGLDILTTGDFTHPLWFKEIRELLEEGGEGVYKFKSQNSKVKNTTQNSKVVKEILFLLSTEISSIYKQGEKLRRIHNLVFMPNLEAVAKINNELRKRGCNLNADGRPIIGIASKNLLELILGIDERAMLIPCHVWTPHFGVYGSKSGFDSLEDAFGDLSKYVYGVETGISSDPEMNWRVVELKNRSILSFSDAHSPANLGREATVFQVKSTSQNFEVSYEDIRRGIMRDSGGRLEIGYTVEFYPEEGKYHYSGHRTCKISRSPKEIGEKGNLCSACRREFTEGVAIRIEQLAGANFAIGYQEKVSIDGIKWYTDKTGNHPPYVKLVRLEQVIAAGNGVSDKSKKVKPIYDRLVGEFGSELSVLLRVDVGEIERVAGEGVAVSLEKTRRGDLVIEAGFDGEYGRVRIGEVPDGISLRGKKRSGEKTSKEQLGLEF